MESNIKLGKLFGIEIGVNYSWFIIFFLITFSLWSSYRSEYKSLEPQWHVGLALLTSLLFFASLLAHELSHSLLALAKGLPVHSITLFVFGGVSKIEKEAMNAATEFWVGIIGPISSAIIAGFFYLLGSVVGGGGSPFATMFMTLAAINLMLAIFNLIPGYPLDGGRVLRAAVWAITGSAQKATSIAATIGQLFAYLFILTGIFWAFGKNDFFNGLWIAFIGWFLLDAAKSSLQAMVFERAMKGVRVRDVMRADVPTVPGHIPLSDFFEDYLMRLGRRCFIVTRDDQLIGLLTPHEIKSIPRDQWPATSVQQVMKPFQSMKWVEPNAELRRVLEIMQQDDVNQVPVVSDGHLEGLVRREDLLRFIATRAEFDY
jgi:Zn-dependent protease/predicted transcriptional regulator